MPEPDLTIREFLEAAVPLAGMRWEGFRRVWRSVRGSVREAAREAGVPSLGRYLDRVRRDPIERERLRRALSVTISRFHRGVKTFEVVCREALAWPAQEVRAWCAGCASGEEPYTLAIFWRERVLPSRPDLPIAIHATDVHEEALVRARRGVYPASAVRWVPTDVRDRMFTEIPEGWRIADELRNAVEFRHHDLLADPPPASNDVVFCRNLALTYFGPDLLREALSRIHASLRPGGLLAIGDRETWDLSTPGFEPVPGDRALFRRRP